MERKTVRISYLSVMLVLALSACGAAGLVYNSAHTVWSVVSDDKDKPN